MTFAVPITALGLVVLVLIAALGVAVSQRRRRARSQERGVVEALAREAVFEHCGEAVVVLDREGRVVHRNDAAEALLGPLGGSDAQRPLMARFPALDGVAPVAPSDDGRHPLWVEGRHLDARRTALRDATGTAVGSVLWVREGPCADDDDARSRALSCSDEIMGIPNRAHFLELLRRELLRARRYGRSLALVVVRLDRFRDTVGAHGAEAADALLRAVAATVMADLRATETLGRLRDDALAVCLPDADAARAEAGAERLRQELAQIEVRAGGAAVRASAVVAVVHTPPDGGHDAADLVARAEAAAGPARPTTMADVGRQHVPTLA